MNMKQIEKARQLLPWYITGKLSPLDVTLVEDAMTLDASLREEYETQQKLSQMIKKDPQLMEISVISTQEQRMDALMDRIRAEKPVVAPPPKSSSFFTQKLDSFKQLLMEFSKFSGFSFNKRLVFATVASIVFIQVAVFSFFLNQQSGDPSSNEYKLMHEASSESPPVAGTHRILVIFSPTATEQERQQVLQAIDGRAVKYEGGRDAYELVFSQQTAEEQIEALILKMNDNKIVEFVGRS